MGKITIRDIYAGMPDAKDEITTDQADKFFESVNCQVKCNKESKKIS